MHTTQPRQHGFTLIEVTLSASVAAIVMGGIASAVVIAARAMPNPDSGLQRTVSAYHIAEQIASELYCAKTFTERTATAIEFTVADRNQDANPETIRYEWSSTSGDPLLRQYNGGTMTTLLDAVSDFQLTYTLQTLTETTPGPATEYPFYPVVDIAGIAPIPSTGFAVTATNWCGMYFALDPATAPPDSRTWTVDQVSFRLRATSPGGGTGFTAVQLRTVDGNGLPTTTVLDQYLVDENPLDNKNWSTRIWNGVASPTLDANEGVCVVFNVASGTDPGIIQFQDTSGVAAASMTSFLTTSDAGASWTSSPNEALTDCTIFGTVTSGGAVETTRYFLSSVGIAMQPGSQASTRVVTSVEILNKLETTGP